MRDKSLKLKVGDICVATAYRGIVYWLIVTKRTPETVTLARLERKVINYDEKTQQGLELPLLDDKNRPVFSRYGEVYRRWTDFRTRTFRKLVNYESKNPEIVYLFGRHSSFVKRWDGKAPVEFSSVKDGHEFEWLKSQKIYELAIN